MVRHALKYIFVMKRMKRKISGPAVDIEAIKREAYAQGYTQGKRDAEARVQTQAYNKRCDDWEKAERERNYERARQDELNDPLEQARIINERQNRFGF